MLCSKRCSQTVGRHDHEHLGYPYLQQQRAWYLVQYMSFIGIRTLLLCVTRGYGDHPPLTSDAALEEEMRSQLEHAVVALQEPQEGGRDQLGGDERWMHADSQSDGPASLAR